MQVLRRVKNKDFPKYLLTSTVVRMAASVVATVNLSRIQLVLPV